jgi:hypothetical protein
MSKEIVYWKQKDGKLVSIDDMDTNHLKNVLKMIVKNSSKHKDKLEKEAYWKKQNEKVFLNGDAANMFNDDMQNYEYKCDATEIDIY